MKIFFLTSIAAASILCLACEKTEINTSEIKPAANTASQNSQIPHAASTQPKDGEYTGKGKVTKLNPDMPSVELNHQEIVGVMPPMIMEFYVKDSSLLAGLAVGDTVEFTLEYKHPSETIVAIKKVQ